MELETRNFEIRKVNKEDRTVTGIAVPFDVATEVGGYKEKFARGAIANVEGVKLFWEHREVIGKVISGTETDAGYEVTARFSDTTLGRDAHTLAMDGVVDRFSVGFLPVEHTVDEETGTVTRTKVDLKEVSLVPFPAYAGAQVSEVRAEQNNADESNTKEVVSDDTTNENMDNENTYDDSEIRSQLEVVQRDLAVVRENGIITEPVSEYRSAGEWGVAFIKGDAKAAEALERATVTSASGHNSNDWSGGLLAVVNNGRPLVNLFDKSTVAKGHKTVEFLKALTVSGAVAVQSTEGTTISNMSGSVSTGTATYSTYAAYIDASFQTADWSDVDLVDGLLRAAAASYASVTNAAVRTALTGASPQTGSSFTLSSATAANYLTAVTDAAQKIQLNATLARTVDFAVASTDVFNSLAALVDTSGRPINVIPGQNGMNTTGNANPLGINVTFAGLPVVWDGNLSSKSLYICSKSAVGVWENAGAPLDLQAINVTALTKQYALYGYLATAVKDANGIVKANIA